MVFDTETTGLTLHPDASEDKQPRIIEFGAVILSRETGEIIMEGNMLIHPGEEITEEITRITGITNEMLAHEGNFAERRERISKMFGWAWSVVAHNLPFDKKMIFNDVKRVGGSEPGSSGLSMPWPKKEFCTVGIYREEYGKQISMKDLYADKLGKPLAQTHRALDDVKALVEIIQHERLWEIMQ